MKVRAWLQGGGLAMLYLLPPLGEFLSPAHRDFYHQLLPITTLMRGMLIDLLFLGVLGGAGFLFLDRAPVRVRHILWLPLFFITGWIVDRDISTWISSPTAQGEILRWAPRLPWLVLAAAACLLLLAPRIYQYATRAVSVVFAAGGIALLLVVLPRLVPACFHHLPQESASSARPVAEPWQPGKLRVVWVLFDELSYQQVFAHRPPGIALPAFQKFADQSISFSDLMPVGDRTERVIPSLFLGRPVADVKGDAEGRLLWKPASDAPWQGFDQNATLFAEAARQGWGSGIAGWYNPYCRILNDVVNRCYWTFGQSVAGRLFSRLTSRQSSWQNALDGLPLAARMETMWRHEPQNLGLLEDYRNLMVQGEALIQDPKIRFAFIHLPIPHPPGLFAKPGVPGSNAYDYLGNLLLADQAMAELDRSVASSPAAADTVFIVSSDHSWRVWLWRNVPGWTRAEERASNGGVFDPRPVLMVRFPGTDRAERIDQPESAMIVHGLLLGLIDGKIRTANDWTNLLQHNRSQPTNGRAASAIPRLNAALAEPTAP